MKDCIASSKVRGTAADGTQLTIQVRIGRPYQKDDVSWACPVSLQPLYGRLADAVGGDAVQALCLAMSLVIDLLDGFRESGGKLTYEDGTEVPLESYAFGLAASGGARAS